MKERVRSKLTYANVMVTILAFVVLGGVSYAATGSNFILGQSNSAGAPTQLSSPTTNASGALKVSNTSTTNPGRGITVTGGAGGYGIYASGGNHAKNTAAVHGQSAAGNAVEGYSTANPASGIFGQDNNANSYGVAGHSDNGTAVVGDSSHGWAMQALGDATQARDGGGFAKVMVHVVGGTGIGQCYNSQLPPSQASTTPCGITFDHPSNGVSNLTFSFQVDDRFVVATPEFGSTTLSVHPVSSQNDELNVRTSNSVTGSGTDTGYYLVLF
jgi:hypothetical protein